MSDPDPTERLVEKLGQAELVVNILRNGLLAICTAGDASPFSDDYRNAGGGYEGLQAVARKALDVAAQAEGKPAR